MEPIVDYLLKSAGVLSIFILVYHFLLRRLTFFNANRWFLLIGIAASMLFPLVEITQTVYVEQTESVVFLPPSVNTPMAAVLESAQVSVEEPFDYWKLAIYLYGAIVVFFLGKMFTELTSLYRLIRSGKKIKSGKFMMVTLSRKLTPFSFFNYICYSDEEQSSPELDLIIDHEKVHAREWHTIDLLISHLFRAVFWINPLVWLLKRQIGENLEFIADYKAKTQNKTGISYERTLLSTAASHMQPALANNFFTPFIKKRIMMLQKEASKTWNAYKYALILPVIVLFLYSFNVVEKVEYITQEKDNTSLFSDPGVVFKNLTFDISGKTTQPQLDKYAGIINNYAAYDVKFGNVLRNENNEIQNISILTKFPGKKWSENFSFKEDKGIQTFHVSATDKILKVNLEENKETLHISESGVEVIANEVWKPSTVLSDHQDTGAELGDETIHFTIDAESTEADLEEKKSFLKERYNVDFEYSRLKIKKGRIVRLKIKLNDNHGFKGEQSYSNSDGIPNICVDGIIKNDTQQWKMSNCEELTSITTPRFKSFDFHTLGENSPIQIDSIMKIYSGNFKAFKMDSLMGMIDMAPYNFKDLNVDSLQTVIKKQFKSQNWDSIQIDLQTRFSEMNFDSLQTAPSFRFNTPQTFITTDGGNTIHTNSNVKVEFDSMTGDDQPLIIINGKEATTEEMTALKNDEIISMTVLKDKASTQLYGEKGKDGVIVITTTGSPSDMEYRKATKSRLKAQKAAMKANQEARKAEYQERRESLKSARDAQLEAKKAQFEAKRTILISKRDSIKKLQVNQINTYQIPESQFIITNVSKTGFEQFEKELEAAGHSFKLKTHRMKGDVLRKLKIEVDGSTHSYVNNKGIKELTIKYFKGQSSPSISMIPKD